MGLGLSVWGSGTRDWGLGVKVETPDRSGFERRFRAWNSGRRVRGWRGEGEDLLGPTRTGFGLGLRVWGTGMRVWG